MASKHLAELGRRLHEASDPADRAATLTLMAKSARQYDGKAYEALALEAMARSWEACVNLPQLHIYQQGTTNYSDAEVVRRERLECAELALRDAQVFATLAQRCD